MTAQSWIATTYLTYLAISLGLTLWVGRTLFRHGRVFLVDVFDGDSGIADAVNRLLAVGFYLLNLGWITLALKLQGNVADLRGAIEALAVKVGAAALVLGALHVANLVVLMRLRSNARRGPVPEPAEQVPATPAGNRPQNGWTVSAYGGQA